MADLTREQQMKVRQLMKEGYSYDTALNTIGVNTWSFRSPLNKISTSINMRRPSPKKRHPAIDDHDEFIKDLYATDHPKRYDHAEDDEEYRYYRSGKKHSTKQKKAQKKKWNPFKK